MIKIYNANNKEFVSSYGTSYKLNNLTDLNIIYNAFPLLSAPTGLTSDTSDPNWTISANSYLNSSDDCKAYNAFSGATELYEYPTWHSASSTQPNWLCWKNNKQKVLVKKLSICCRGYGTQPFASFKLQGSNDGLDWNDLLNVTGLSWSSGEFKTWTLPDNNKGFYYHRIYITSSENYTTICQLKAWSKIE